MCMRITSKVIVLKRGLVAYKAVSATKNKKAFRSQYAPPSRSRQFYVLGDEEHSLSLGCSLTYQIGERTAAPIDSPGIYLFKYLKHARYERWDAVLKVRIPAGAKIVRGKMFERTPSILAEYVDVEKIMERS